jgi:hypothetical protein
MSSLVTSPSELLSHVSQWVGMDLLRHLGWSRKYLGRAIHLIREVISNDVYGGCMVPAPGPHKRITVAKWYELMNELGGQEFTRRGYWKLKRYPVAPAIENKIRDFLSIVAESAYEVYTWDRYCQWLFDLGDIEVSVKVSEWYDQEKSLFLRTFARNLKREKRLFRR